MQSNSPPTSSFAYGLLVNFLAPIALIAVATLIFVSLGTVEPPKRPAPDMSRSGRLQALAPIRVEPIRALDTAKTPLFLSVDGTVVPFEEANVAAEVAGRILRKSDKCEAGTFVKQGELLMEIDPEDYELEVQRLSQLKDQEYQRVQELDQEMINTQKLINVAEQDVEIQKKETRRLQALPEGFAAGSEIDQASRSLLASTQQLITLQNQLDLQRKQRTRIEASERLAATQLQVAEVNLRRTKIVAPIDGIIVSEQIDVNTFVSRGSSLVIIENTSKVEVSTSLRMDQLYWILDQSSQQENQNPTNYDLPETEAIIEYEVAGRNGKVHQWRGKLMSYDGIGLDPKTRTVPVRVIVDRPSEFIKQDGSSISSATTTPLVRGMFVRIRLLIHPKTKLFLIPTKAMQPGNRIYEFTPDDSVLNVTESEVDYAENSPALPQDQSSDFDMQRWTAGRVRIRDSVIPVNSLALGNQALSSNSNRSNKTSNTTVLESNGTTESNGATRDFWVCEVVGMAKEQGTFVVTSPLGTVSESAFSARAEDITQNEFEATQPTSTQPTTTSPVDNSSSKAFPEDQLPSETLLEGIVGMSKGARA